MSNARSNLSDAKRALLAQRLKGRTGTAAPSIPPAPRDRPIPLSFAQQRLWFLDQLGLGAAYNMSQLATVRSPLDAEAIERSLDAIAERHETLRTVFVEHDDEPVQVIRASVKLPFRVVDLTAMPEGDRAGELERLIVEETRTPFDLAEGPLLRAALARLAPDEHLLSITMHHIIGDDWSQWLLMEELLTLYHSLRTGTPAELPPLSVQYADYAVWQRGHLQSDELERQLAYWKAQLGGLPALHLPTDRPYPPEQTFDGGVFAFALPPELTAKLSALSRENGVTITTTLLAAFQILLGWYANQRDVVVGMPVANRVRSELEGLIGFFVGTLVVRTQPEWKLPFTEFLRSVHRVCLEAYAHQDVPFEMLVEALRPERNLSRNPIFQVTFGMQAPLRHVAPSRDLVFEPYAVGPTVTRFDLELNMRELSTTVAGALCYRLDLFDGATIERMAEHYRLLLERIAANPEAPIGSFTVLAPAERQRLLVDWNPTSTGARSDATIHELFEAQATARPNAAAVSFEGTTITYGELNRRANQLAHHLIQRGVEPGSMVGLCVERSVEMVVAILGILKAGGAYVPLDTANPTQRIAFILEDTRVPVLVTQRSVLEKLPEHRAEVICLDREEAELECKPAENPAPRARPGDVAYVIYTSGSTGRPKGVQVEHGHVVRLFRATEDWFRFDEHDVWTLFHSFAFDFTVWELWGALLYGGRLVVVPYLVSRSPDRFRQVLQREGVTVLNQTPSAFYELIRADEQAGGDLSLRLVIFGGEALNIQALRPWFERHGDERPQLVNMYGITETTVHVTYRPLTAADLQRAPGSVIGRPIPDLRVYILDENFEPAPVGVAGELYVGGAGVARGYLSRPALTAERFVPDPFGPSEGGRLYRTGDVARFLRNRDIEYLGRNDEQVKIRGHRIELGEIEAALAGLPAIRDALVQLREDTPGDKRLVAYLVASDGDRPAAGEVRRRIGDRLPSYSIPAAFVFLETLPLTPNGKVDRRALPAPEGERQVDDLFTAPRDELEERIAVIWREMLGVEKVGVRDNFFDLGGHSLLATRVTSRLRSTLGIELSARVMFETPTVEALAQEITRRMLEAQDPEDVAQMMDEIMSLSEEQP